MAAPSGDDPVWFPECAGLTTIQRSRSRRSRKCLGYLAQRDAEGGGRILVGSGSAAVSHRELTTALTTTRPPTSCRLFDVNDPGVDRNCPVPAGGVRRPIALWHNRRKGTTETSHTHGSVIRWSRVRAPPAPLNSPLVSQRVHPRPRADAIFAEIRDGRRPTAFPANALRRAGWLPAQHL